MGSFSTRQSGHGGAHATTAARSCFRIFSNRTASTAAWIARSSGSGSEAAGGARTGAVMFGFRRCGSGPITTSVGSPRPPRDRRQARSRARSTAKKERPASTMNLCVNGPSTGKTLWSRRGCVSDRSRRTIARCRSLVLSRIADPLGRPRPARRTAAYSREDGSTLFTRSTLRFSPEHLSFSDDQPDKTIEKAAERLRHFSHQLLCGDIVGGRKDRQWHVAAAVVRRCTRAKGFASRRSRAAAIASPST